VQVDPIKPILKAPKTKRLKLEYDVLPSNFAVKFTLRRYTAAHRTWRARQGLAPVQISAQRKRFLWDRGYIEGVFKGCL
jgi:hypothetical protein